MEYKYFVCKKCGAVYVSSATDKKLREDIEKYQKIIGEYKGESITPEIIKEAQELLKQNVNRSRELKEKYPLELKTWEK